jgi:hypothetical protein
MINDAGYTRPFTVEEDGDTTVVRYSGDLTDDDVATITGIIDSLAPSVGKPFNRKLAIEGVPLAEAPLPSQG